MLLGGLLEVTHRILQPHFLEFQSRDDNRLQLLLQLPFGLGFFIPLKKMAAGLLPAPLTTLQHATGRS